MLPLFGPKRRFGLLPANMVGRFRKRKHGLRSPKGPLAQIIRHALKE